MHFIVIIDNTTYKIVKYSVPFKFKGDVVEFCLGLLLEADEFTVCFSRSEIKTYALTYDRKLFESTFF